MSKPGKLRRCFTPLILFALLGTIADLCGLFSCGGSLNPEGKVVAWNTPPDPALAKIAAGIKGLEYMEDEKTSPWYMKLAAGQTTPDLISTDWNNDLIGASKSKLLFDLGSRWQLTKNGGHFYKSVAVFTKVGNDHDEFFPASTYLWLLCYNSGVLKKNGISPPQTLGDLEGAFRKLKTAGVQPLAMSSAFGWTALAWFSILDIRYNGADAYLALIRGTRAADDASLNRVYQTLYDWRAAGWISSDSSAKTWSDALADVEQGKAAFNFAAAYAQTKLTRNGVVEFVQAPKAETPVSAGELGLVQGFSVAAKSAYPESGLALADAYLSAGIPGQLSEGYRVPVVSGEKQDSLNELQKLEVSIIQNTNMVLPQLDRALPSQKAYNLNQAMIRFFSKSSTMKVDDLKALVKAAIQ